MALHLPRVAVALGDPAGIGAEVVLGSLCHPSVQQALEPVLFGCRNWLQGQYRNLGSRGRQVADPADVAVVDLPLSAAVTSGEGTADTGAAAFRWLTAAAEAVLGGDCDALCTAPIAKYCWQAAGHHYAGQTERLADIAGCGEVSMLFTARSPHCGWRFNTLLATTHVPLVEVPRRLSPALVQRQLTALAAFCERFTAQPGLKVAGLNPHAGEQGNLGDDECRWLAPCLEQWQQQHPHCTVQGPAPPDTCWLDAAQAWTGKGAGADGYLALYHDQGLIPTKLIAFDAAVNTTLGLPFVRTSPDHGTAFTIAGQGVAREASMVAALLAAADLFRAA